MEGEQTSTSRYSTSKPVANSGFQMCGGFSSRKFAITNGFAATKFRPGRVVEGMAE